MDKGAYRTCTSPYVVGGLGEGRHRLSVEATDSAGNVDPTPAARTLVVDQAAAAGTLFSDDFETGNLSRWTVTKAGTGTAVAQTAVVQHGHVRRAVHHHRPTPAPAPTPAPRSPPPSPT